MRRTAALLGVAWFAVAACTGSTARPGGSAQPAGPSIRASGGSASSAATGQGQPDLAKVEVRFVPIADLDHPLAMAVRRGDRRLYVAGQSGIVYALTPGQNGSVREILNIRDRISFGGEQGLLGLAFSPDGRFLYINYTDVNGDTNVDECRMAGNGSVQTATRRQVLFVHQPFSNHNGGDLVFGPDGYLYIGLGDGGSGGDPFGNGQNLGTLLGKMLRIDPRQRDGRPYGIPPGNPFIGLSGARPEIWDYGLRNPWRYSFDRDTGDLWIGDVGQDTREEIDLEPAGSGGGRNYGWHAFEGRLRYTNDPAPRNAIPPLMDYGHENGACAVTGGYDYRGRAIPSLRGAYLYSDYCEGLIMALVQRGGRVVQRRTLSASLGNVSSFGQDAGGELYVLTLGGRVYRIAPG